MSNYQKILQKMRDNTRDWRIEDIKVIVKQLGVEFRQPGGSHVTFRFPNGKKVTIPAHKPIKPIYIRQFIALVDDSGAELK